MRAHLHGDSFAPDSEDLFPTDFSHLRFATACKYALSYTPLVSSLFVHSSLLRRTLSPLMLMLVQSGIHLGYFVVLLLFPYPPLSKYLVFHFLPSRSSIHHISLLRIFLFILPVH